MDKYFAAPIVMSLITIITAIVGKSLYMLLSVSMTFVSVIVSISQYISQIKSSKMILSCETKNTEKSSIQYAKNLK